MDDAGGNCIGVVFLIGLAGAAIVAIVGLVFCITVACATAGGVSGTAAALWQSIISYARTFRSALKRSWK